MLLSPLFDLLGLSGLKLLPRGPERQDFSAAIKRGRGRPNHPHESVDPATGPWPLGYFHDYYAVKVGTGRKDYDRAVKAVSSWQHADALPWVSTNKPRLLSPGAFPWQRRKQKAENDDSGGGGSSGGLVIAARAAGPFLPFVPLWIVNPLKIVEVKKEGRSSGGVPSLGGGGGGGREEEGFLRRRQQQQRRRRQGGLFPPPPSPVPPRCRPASLSRGRSFSVRATTCSSHVLAGAESFSVFINEGGEGEKEKGSVWFEVASFSRPAAALSLLTLPLVRVLQSRFRKESARAVAEAVREGK